jgi:hypothetical protein
VKVGEVPQDPGSCLAGHRKLNYAVGEDGRYAGVPTIGWEVETAATEVGARATARQIAAAWAEARSGSTSPLGYHMAAVQMDARQLASDAGVWAWQVRRHLRPAVFASLSPSRLARYADALGSTLAQLCSLPDTPDTR